MVLAAMWREGGRGAGVVVALLLLLPLLGKKKTIKTAAMTTMSR